MDATLRDALMGDNAAVAYDVKYRVHPGGWIKTSAAAYVVTSIAPTCELCHRTYRGAAWYNLKRRAMRCPSCQEQSWKSQRLQIVNGEPVLPTKRQ